MPVEPQVRIFQELTQLPTSVVEQLRAFIFGPEYDLHRYTVESEKGSGFSYDPSLGVTKEWLADFSRRAGASVDLDYTRAFLEEALLEYFTSGGAGQTPNDERNKVKISGVNLVDKDGYSLDAAFQGRSVKIGDFIQVDDGSTSGGGTITGFEAETTASQVSSAAAGADNQADTTLSAPSETTVTGSIDIIAGGTYDGIEDGVLSETYTIDVRRGSTGGDPTTMILDITTSSGTDDVLGFVPQAANFTTDIDLGTRGLTFQFDMGVALDVPTGNQYTVAVTQAYTAPTPTSAGTYTGPQDTTYIVEVVEGGDGGSGTAADQPLIKVLTATGIDSSSTVRYSGGTVSVGNYGVTLTFSTDILVKGDRYLVPVTAEGEGAIQTVELNTSLPVALVSTSGSPVTLNVSLSIKKDTEFFSEIFDNGQQTNWSQDANGITFQPGASLFDNSWQDGQEALNVIGGTVFVHWRELVTDNASGIQALSKPSDIETVLGTPVDPDNPLAYAASKAIANSGGRPVHAMGVPTNDLAGYQSVLDIAENNLNVYTLVPLTYDGTVWNAVESHVNSMSAPENNRYRTAIFSAEEVDPAPVVYKNSDDSPVLATLDANKFLDINSGSDVQLITAGVRPGDTVRINFETGQVGNTGWEEFTVDQVLSETRLKTTTAPSTPISVASKVEIWRNQTPADVVEWVGDQATGLDNRRITLLFPGKAPSGGVMVEGYHLAAAVAGLRSGVPPHQGLTRVELVGFDNMDRVTNRFSKTQLDTLSDSGVWIVSQDLSGDSIYTRHAITTNLSGLNEQEEMITRNLDSISYFMFNKLNRYIGRANVTESTTNVLRTQLEGAISFLQSSSQTELLGGQLIDGDIVTLRPHTIFRDRYVIRLDLQLPFPANNIDLTVVV